MSPPVPIFDEPWTEGDTGPPLIFTSTGEDLTGFTVRLRLQRPGAAAALVKTITEVSSADGQITDAANGVGQFNWVAGDLLAGDQPATIEFVTGAGIIENTERFIIPIAEKIA